MAKPVKWLRKALKSLEQAYDYTAEADQTAAISLVLKIQSATQQLADFPLLGREGRVDGTRELVIANTPYLVVYRVKGKTVEILRVLHGSRKYPE
jgi:toxin ParE1/3/4